MSILEETSLQTENGLATEEHDLSENKSYLSDKLVNFFSIYIFPSEIHLWTHFMP